MRKHPILLIGLEYVIVRDPVSFPLSYPGDSIFIPQVAQEHVYYIPMPNGDMEIG